MACSRLLGQLSVLKRPAKGRSTSFKRIHYPQAEVVLYTEPTMDFIERLFGWSPDGGNGMLELLLLVGLIAIPAVRAWRRKEPSPGGRDHLSR